MDLHVRLQVLTFGEPTPTLRKFAAEGLGAKVKMHVVVKTYFSLKRLATSHFRTLKALLRFVILLSGVLTLLEQKCLRI